MDGGRMMKDGPSGEPGQASGTSCGGCGRSIPLPSGFPGNRFLCAACHYPQVNPEGKGNVSAARWFRAACLAGVGLVALVGFPLCILYLAGTGSEAWFAILLLVMAIAVALPLAVLLRRRHLGLVASALYLPLGLWCFLWYLAPGVGWGYSSSLLGGGFFFLFLGAGSLYLYGRDLRSLPRW